MQTFGCNHWKYLLRLPSAVQALKTGSKSVALQTGRWMQDFMPGSAY
jgi:hypothetical protein